LRGYLAAIAIFCNEVKGKSALGISRDLSLEAGIVAEVDGGYFGGYLKPANHRENRRDRRLARNQSGKRKAVVIIRERNGRSLPAVFRTEGQALSFIRARIAKGTIVNADESSSWDALHATYEMKCVNHDEAYSLDGACTNWAEEFFSRMRRAEAGHHHICCATRKKLLARRPSPDQQWRTGSHGFWSGDEARAVCGFLWILAALHHSIKLDVDIAQ
jgi:hypothetical protein